MWTQQLEGKEVGRILRKLLNPSSPEEELLLGILLQAVADTFLHPERLESKWNQARQFRWRKRAVGYWRGGGWVGIFHLFGVDPEEGMRYLEGLLPISLGE